MSCSRETCAASVRAGSASAAIKAILATMVRSVEVELSSDDETMND